MLVFQAFRNLKLERIQSVYFNLIEKQTVKRKFLIGRGTTWEKNLYPKSQFCSFCRPNRLPFSRSRSTCFFLHLHTKSSALKYLQLLLYRVLAYFVLQIAFYFPDLNLLKPTIYLLSNIYKFLQPRRLVLTQNQKLCSLCLTK